MSGYYIPDLSGVLPEYLQANFPYFIFRNGMKIEFKNSPIFADSLRIAFTDGSGLTLIRDIDWTVNPEDIDESATSEARLENQAFSATLAKSVTIISNKALNKQVALTFQEFYLVSPGMSFDDGTPFELTPDVIKGLLSGQADLRQQVARVTSPVAPVNATPSLLPFDINAEKPGNVIVGEVVTINTVAGAKVIRFVEGAFFWDSVTLSFNGAPLSKSTDYVPIMVSPLTQQSTNKSGIYQYVLINGTFAGQITADYHAVGGEVQISDVSTLSQQMVAITTFLNDALFITKETVTETPAFQAINSRLNLVEDDMRKLLTGNPTYGDSTAGTAVLRPISAVDANFHWWTIADLYQVQGSNDIITADQWKGRVYFPGSNVSVGVTVDLNINQTRNRVSFDTNALVFDPMYTLFNDLRVGATVIPMFRVCWNQASQSFSGAVLQIGIPLPALSDMMTVEDMSSPESCWLLDRTGEFVSGQTVDPTQPQDNGFTLPDGASIWSSASSVSFSQVYVPPFKNGYLMYAGSNVLVNQLNVDTSTGGLFNVVLPSYFPVDAIKEVVVTLISPDAQSVYDVEIPMTALISGTRQGRTTYADSQSELMGITALIIQDSLSNISISLNVSDVVLSLGTTVTGSMTDVVRYIRVRV